MNELDRILALTRTELERRRRALAPEELARAAAGGRERPAGGASFSEALSSPGLGLIAEHKRRSPSAGLIRDGVVLEQVIAAYERGGAAAISVLTEGPSFGGSLDDLRAARAVSGLPILRKDFIVDRYQIDEAVVAGADAILLIVAALDPAELRALRLHAGARGLGALVEVHDERELERALESGATVVGINNRDLTTLEVDVRRTFELLPLIPEGILVVAESGLTRRDELDELRGAGVDAVLIGEALMRAPDIESAVRTLTGIRPSVH
jgi:indole-3-glycerol phosphate synthase